MCEYYYKQSHCTCLVVAERVLKVSLLSTGWSFSRNLCSDRLNCSLWCKTKSSLSYLKLKVLLLYSDIFYLQYLN